MDMPTSAVTGLTLQELFDAGLHFGHQTKRWNPKMKSYIFDKRNGIHIIDLTQTVTLIDEAASFLKKIVLDGRKVLFVATKKQAQELVKTAATSCGQFYVTERWLGGTLTNEKTLRGSVKRMCQLQAIARQNNGELSKHKQENSMLRRELAKLEKNLTGIAEMNRLPGALFVVDVCREANAVREATRLGIPVVAIVDTNADPDPIDYVIPGNDDSVKGVELIVNGMVKAITQANDEYSAKVADEAKKAEEERRARDEAAKAEREARRQKAAEEKAAAGEKAVKDGLKAPRAKKTGVTNAVKQAARAAKEAKMAEASAKIAEKRAAAAAEAAVAAAPAAEPAPAAAPEAPAAV